MMSDITNIVILIVIGDGYATASFKQLNRLKGETNYNHTITKGLDFDRPELDRTVEYQR
jgi:hypothetical protein